MANEKNSSSDDPKSLMKEAIDTANSIINNGPDVLANIEMANDVAYGNLEQQNQIVNQQAVFQLRYATVAKCIEVIMSIDPDSENASQKIKTYKELLEGFVDLFGEMTPQKPKVSVSESTSIKEEVNVK